MRCKVFLTTLLLCLMAGASLPAQTDSVEPGEPPKAKLRRNPRSRNELDEASKRHDEQALTVEATYVVEALSNLNGGVERGSDVLGSFNLVLDLDAHQAFGWKGTSFHAYLLGNHGGPFTRRVGDFQTVSNIEAPQTLSLYQGYVEQTLWEKKLSVLLGLYAVDSEFDTRGCAGLFVHSSPGTGGDIGQLGENGPGIYPVGALGTRLRYRDQGWYGQLAVVEGVPGDPQDPFGTTLRLQGGEGVFWIVEGGRRFEDESGSLGKIALGGWGFSEPQESVGDPARQMTNRGVYLSLDKVLSRERGRPEEGLSGFLRVGRTDGQVDSIETYLGAGLVYTGLFEGRDKDQLGLAVSSGFAGSRFLRSGEYRSHETALELTYAFAVNESVTVQPDLQYIIHPGFDTGLDAALVAGLRATFFFSN